MGGGSSSSSLSLASGVSMAQPFLDSLGQRKEDRRKEKEP